MIELTEQQQLYIRAELARAMGWTAPIKHGFDRWRHPNGATTQDEPPDPFTSAADSRALVEWLATQSQESDLEVFNNITNKWFKVRVWEKFLVELQFILFRCDFINPPLHIVMNLVAAPLETIPLAAARALGIEVDA